MTLIPQVVGVDVSLRSTGVATTGGTTVVVSSGRRRDDLASRHARLSGIATDVLREVGRPDLAVVEGPSHHSPGGSAWDRGGLWWLILHRLLRCDVPVAVMAPMARAKYATGKGTSGKAAVLDAVRERYGLAAGATDDEADALVLRAAGLDWMGYPLASVPERHRAALGKVAWPEWVAGREGRHDN